MLFKVGVELGAIAGDLSGLAVTFPERISTEMEAVRHGSFSYLLPHDRNGVSASARLGAWWRWRFNDSRLE